MAITYFCSWVKTHRISTMNRSISSSFGGDSNLGRLRLRLGTPSARRDSVPSPPPTIAARLVHLSSMTSAGDQLVTVFPVGSMSSRNKKDGGVDDLNGNVSSGASRGNW